MNIIITIPDEQDQRLVNKIAKLNGYQTQIIDIELGLIDNPITKKQFVKSLIIEFLKRELRQAERQEAIESIVNNDVGIN